MPCICGNSDCTIPYGECHCGCGGRTSIALSTDRYHGKIKGMPRKYLSSHGPSQKQDISARFWRMVDKNGPMKVAGLGNCWIWKGSKSSQGYGRLVSSFDDGSIEQLATRVSWRIHFGKLEKHECVLHRCDNPECTNPSHLFKGSKQDNSDDAVAKGRTARGKRSCRGMFDSKDIVEMRDFKRKGLTCFQIAVMFGCKHQTVNAIVNRRTYKYVSEEQDACTQER